MPKGSKFDYEQEIDDPSPIGYNWNNLKCSCDCLLIFFGVMRLFSLVTRLMPVR